MTTVILVLHIVLAAAMIGIILIQRSEGGALGMGGGNMGGLMSARGTANLLTRVTGILATSFFVTTLVLAIIFKGAQKTKSILDVEETAPALEVPLAQDSEPLKSEKKESDTPVTPDVPVAGSQTSASSEKTPKN